MEELTNKATDLELELLTSATVVMSWLVYLQEFVRIMDSGLEMHHLVRVSRPFICNLSVIPKHFVTVRCPNLPDPSNGRVNQRGNKPGDRATYTCNRGYELQGGFTRICQNNGQWSGEAPTCEREGMNLISGL